MRISFDVPSMNRGRVKMPFAEIVALVILVIVFRSDIKSPIFLLLAGTFLVKLVKKIVKQVRESKQKSQWVCAMLPVIMLQEDKERSYRKSKNGPWYHPQRIVCEGRNPVDGSNSIFDTGMKEIRYDRYVSQGSMVPIYVNPNMPEQYFIDYENAKDPLGYQYGMSVGQNATDEDYAREAQRIAMEMINNPQMMQQMEEQQMQQQIKRSADSITYNRMYGDSLEDPLPGKDYKGDTGWFGILFASVIMIAFGVLAIYMGMMQINLQGGEVNIFVILSVLLSGAFIPIVIGILLIVAAIAIIVINAVSKEPTPEEIAARQPTLTMADKVAMDQMSELEKLQYLHDKSKEAYERNTRNGNYR